MADDSRMTKTWYERSIPAFFCHSIFSFPTRADTLGRGPFSLPGFAIRAMDGDDVVRVWLRYATVQVTAGTHEVVWKNVKGGGIHIDAFAFAREPLFVPCENAPPVSSDEMVVVQGEDLVRFQTKDGALPGGDWAAIWLAGHGAGISNLTVCGSPRVNLGIVIRHPEYPKWLENCRVVEVNVRGCEGRQAENCGIRLYHADKAVVKTSELWGRAPLFLSGVKRSQFIGNRLVSQTLWGGNSEGYILGRNDTVRQCIIEDNVCASPPGQGAGGPTGRRMVWLSTGRGSVDCNWIANNREDRARFGGVAGTDQNVGEMHQLPVELPRCLGNVLRHNSFVRSRTDGVLITGNRPADEQQPTAAILGTIAEFNVVRDASIGYRVARSAEATLLRRNHAYFWYPVNQQPGPRVAFQVDNEKVAVTLELNSVEGFHGGADGQIVPEERGPATPTQ